MPNRPIAFFLGALIAVAAAPTHAQQTPAELTQWVTETARIQYTVFHALHNVRGVSRQVEGFARIDSEGLHLNISAAVTSFVSSNVGRDARLAELVDAAHFPAVRVKAFVPHFSLQQSSAPKELPMTVAITLHGVGTDVPVLAHICFLDAKTMRVRFSLTDSIRAHGLSRPAFLMWPVHDAMQVEGEIDFVAKSIQEMQPKGEYSD